jgi:hypothetical protein
MPVVLVGALFELRAAGTGFAAAADLYLARSTLLSLFLAVKGHG